VGKTLVDTVEMFERARDAPSSLDQIGPDLIFSLKKESCQVPGQAQMTSQERSLIYIGGSKPETKVDRMGKGVKMEVRGLTRDPSLMSEVLGQMRDLPVPIPGRTRFRELNQE